MNNTPIDFFAEQIMEMQKTFGKVTTAKLGKIKQKAEELEREHIIEAFNQGYVSGFNQDRKWGSDYYKENYNQTKNIL